MGLRNDELVRLYQNLPPLDLLSDTKILQRALFQTGFFLESELWRLVRNGGVLAQGDIKAVLFKLRRRMDRALSRSSPEVLSYIYRLRY